MKGSGGTPWHERIFDTDERPNPILLSVDEFAATPEPTVRMRDRWYSLVEDYSTRFSTIETDKLIAIDGLSDVISATLPGFQEKHYVVGMFMQRMPGCLLWQSWSYHCSQHGKVVSMLGTFQPRRSMVYRAPSWSCASIDGEVSYQSQRVDQRSSTVASQLIDSCHVSTRPGPNGAGCATRGTLKEKKSLIRDRCAWGLLW